MQWRMLGRRGRQASWTIVGDAAQSAWPDLDEARRAQQEALRGKQIRRFHLTTNYRNSAEIFEFAAEVVRRSVPDADLPERGTPDRRGAGAPQVVRPPSSRRRCARPWPSCWTAVDGTVGVITPAGAARRRSPAGSPASTTGRVQVVDGMRAKGMEYDGVLVVAPGGDRGRVAGRVRVLYVALTRATHRLVTLAPARTG